MPHGRLQRVQGSFVAGPAREVPGHGSSLRQRLLVLRKVVKGEPRFLIALSQWVAQV